MYTFKLRRATAAKWLHENPVLADGEPGFEINTGRLKIGDGYKTWTELDYFVPQGPSATPYSSLAAHINEEAPHPVYDDGPSLFLLYENAKV